MPGKRLKAATDLEREGVNPTTAYAQLLREELLVIGEKVELSNLGSEDSATHLSALVQQSGLQVGDRILNPSLAATTLLYEHSGEFRPVNGWLVWKVDSGQSLSELYYDRVRRKPKHSDFAGSSLTEYYHKMPKRRDSVFIFGAGASIAEGCPTQGELLPLILGTRDPEMLESKAWKSVSEFIRQNFFLDEEAGQYPSLEEIFGFIDYFIDKRESLGHVFTLTNIEYIREALIKLIHYLINHAMTQSVGRSLDKFWDHVWKNKPNMSCVTLNYDTYLEDSFVKYFPLNCYLNFSYDLMNFQYHLISPKDWWINPSEPLLTTTKFTPQVIKFIKIHGSLNWRYCNCCNQLIIRPWENNFHLEKGNPPWGEKTEARDSTDMAQGEIHQKASFESCPRDQNLLTTLITPPSYKKDLSHPVISKLLIEMADEIRAAEQVVFVGYSLPEADVHLKAVFAKSGISNKKVIVINPSDDPQMKRRFKSLSSKCEIIQKGFVDVMKDEKLMKRLLGQSKKKAKKSISKAS